MRLVLLVPWLASLAVTCAGLDLSPVRRDACDLEIVAPWTDAPAGTVRYAAWEALRTLPTRRLTLEGEFVSGDQEVTVVMLADLWAALPVRESADVVLATCSDGYLAVYPRAVVDRYAPFVVLEINGRGPEHWPPEGLSFNPGPYVISVSARVEPAVAGLLDANHKRPWGVTRLEFASYEEQFAAAYDGARGAPAGPVREGREIWIHSCASCHLGPDGLPGGSKSGQPFEVVLAHAAYNGDYFRRFVRDPKGTRPGSRMEAHPHYTDQQLDALIAFITAPANRPAAMR